MNVFMTGCIVALGILYIGQVNASASKARQVSILEDTERSLHVDNERLAAKIDNLRSLDSVMQREQFLGLVAVQKVVYVSAATETVALR